MPEIAFGRLPFKEQIAYFRRKGNLLTDDWTQLWGAAHDHAFVVAGANRADLLADLRAAVDRAIAEGATLAQFRKDFDAIVAKYGWQYQGGRNWRSRVIYETNLRSSYAAGRYAQLQRLKRVRPYWMYVHSDAVMHPRPQHLAWNGLVLHADDPWWHAHFPPGGWGCQCTVHALDDEGLRRLGKNGPDTAPPVAMRTVTVGTQGAHPRTVEVPEGIDPGFGHTPGATAPWGSMGEQAEQVLANGEDYAAGKWQRLGGETWQEMGRPEQVPFEPAPVHLGPRLSTPEAVQTSLEAMLGAPLKVFDVHGLPVAIDADALARHLQPDRSPYLPLLLDLMRDPWEVWLTLERAPGGHYELRARLIKGYDIGGGHALLLVAQQQGGYLESWTMMPTSDRKYLDRQRQGLLWWGAP